MTGLNSFWHAQCQWFMFRNNFWSVSLYKFMTDLIAGPFKVMNGKMLMSHALFCWESKCSKFTTTKQAPQTIHVLQMSFKVFSQLKVYLPVGTVIQYQGPTCFWLLKYCSIFSASPYKWTELLLLHTDYSNMQNVTFFRTRFLRD